MYRNSFADEPIQLLDFNRMSQCLFIDVDSTELLVFVISIAIVLAILMDITVDGLRQT